MCPQYNIGKYIQNIPQLTSKIGLPDEKYIGFFFIHLCAMELLIHFDLLPCYIIPIMF
jgi:hypothetical protein